MFKVMPNRLQMEIVFTVKGICFQHDGQISIFCEKNILHEMKYILETERLRLREFDLSDTAFIIRLVNSPGWIEFIGDRNIRTDEQARHYLECGAIKSYRENGFGLSMVEKKADSIAIGMCGILKRDTLDNPDIGFAFLPEFTGQGYASEIVKATLNYALHDLKLPKVLAITKNNNARSIKLLERIGLTFDKTFLSDNKEELLLFTS
jgi:RimJ/RimL family protein N-acetyltransferase